MWEKIKFMMQQQPSIFHFIFSLTFAKNNFKRVHDHWSVVSYIAKLIRIWAYIYYSDRNLFFLHVLLFYTVHIQLPQAYKLFWTYLFFTELIFFIKNNFSEGVTVLTSRAWGKNLEMCLFNFMKISYDSTVYCPEDNLLSAI